MGRKRTAIFVERVCANPPCGRTFPVRELEVLRGYGRFCSQHCSGVAGGKAFAAKHPQDGANNHNFKGWASRNKRSYVDRFRANHPEIAAAYKVVKAAFASGTLVRPSACQRCGRACRPHGHHDDYAKPLDVVFACRKCHRKLDLDRQARLSADRIASRDQREHESVATEQPVNQVAR